MKNPKPRPPMWVCPKCGAALVARNMSHSCGVWTLDHHFVLREEADLDRELLRLLQQSYRVGDQEHLD